MKSQYENIEDNPLPLHNTIQLDLACMYFEKPKISSGEFEEWVRQYSKKFREFVTSHFDILSLYNTDRGKALTEIEKELYETK